MTTVYDIACEYAQRHELHVLPVKPREKVPASEHAKDDATTDVAILYQWFADHPERNIGIACGPSQLVTIDADTPKPKNQNTDGRADLKALIEEIGPLPATWTQDTGSGGEQYIFRATAGVPLIGKLGKAIDIIRNGYIVAPPSIHPSGGAYRWRPGLAPGEIDIAELPLAWLEHLRQPTRQEHTAPRRPAQGDDFYSALESLDQRYVLEHISGSSLVSGERFAFKPTARGKWNLLVDRGNGFEGTRNFIDSNGRIAARSTATSGQTDGGPLVSTWLRYYGQTDAQIRRGLVEHVPELAKFAERRRPRSETKPSEPPDGPPPPSEPSSDSLPEIVITTSQAVVVDLAEDALLNAGNVYQRGRMLVHVVRDRSVADWMRCPDGMPVVAGLKPEHLRERIGKAARWLRISKQNHLESAMVPPWVPKTLLERDSWSFPILSGVSNTPILRIDGTIHDRPGYDPKSRMIYDPAGERWPAIQAEPTADDAGHALRDLAEPFCDFPFVADSDRSAMIAFVLSVLARSAIDGNVPLFGISANTPGSGKGLGVEVCSIIATGEKASHMTPVNDDNEMRKRLFAIAIAAPRLANIDNVDGDLGCASLDAALTASSISDRVLGASEVRSIPLTTVFSATGNNLTYRGDLARRVVPVEIDPGVENPEDRTNFRHPNLEAYVRMNRPRLVVAALTLLRAFILAGKPSHGQPSKGSFGAWDRLIRGAIMWSGGADPLGGVERLRQRGDASIERISALLVAWEAAFGQLEVTVAEAIRRASEGSELRDAMNAFGAKDRAINAQLLGTRLSKLRGRIVGGRSFEDSEDVTRDGVRRWKVVRR